MRCLTLVFAMLYTLQAPAQMFASQTLRQGHRLNADWAPQWGSLMSYWKMDGDITDTKGAITGTQVGTIPYLAPGRIGGQHAAVPTYNTDYFEAGDISALEGIDKFTVSIWYKFSEFVDWRGLWGKTFSTTSGISLGLNGNFGGNTCGTTNTILIANVRNGFDTGVCAKTTTLEAEKWYHIVVVYDGTLAGSTNRLKIYINGLLRSGTQYGGNTVPATTASNTAALYVGKAVGEYSDVAIWTTALTAGEVMKLYYGQGN